MASAERGQCVTISYNSKQLSRGANCKHAKREPNGITRDVTASEQNKKTTSNLVDG